MPHRRLRKAVDNPDSDYGSGDDRPQTMVQENKMNLSDKERRAAAMLMHDLGVQRRDYITTDDIAPVGRLNVQLVRDCDRKGTEAASKAKENKEALSGWLNYGESAENECAHEILPDIAGGQTHRLNREQQEPKPEQQSRFGQDASRGRGSGGRGGGFVGRGTGRIAPANRPLDPAVDPDREYTYKGRGPNIYSAAKSSNIRVSMMNNGDVKMGKHKAHNPNTLTSKSTQIPGPSMRFEIDRLLGRNNKGKTSSSSMPSTNRPASATLPRFKANLASPESFMAALSIPPSHIKPNISNPEQAKANSNGTESPRILQVPATELRSTALLSPNALTSGRPSPAELSLSPSSVTDSSRNGEKQDDNSNSAASNLSNIAAKYGQSHVDAIKPQVSRGVHDILGLGISETTNGPRSSTVKPVDCSSKLSPIVRDLMDSTDFKVETPSLVASPRTQSLPLGMELIQSIEAAKWRIIKAHIESGDNSALMLYVKSLQIANFETKHSSKDHITTYDGYKIGKQPAKNINSLLGDHNVATRKAVVPTESKFTLHASKHAPVNPTQRFSLIEEGNTSSSLKRGLDSPWEKSMSDALAEVSTSNSLTASPALTTSTKIGRDNPFATNRRVDLNEPKSREPYRSVSPPKASIVQPAKKITTKEPTVSLPLAERFRVQNANMKTSSHNATTKIKRIHGGPGFDQLLVDIEAAARKGQVNAARPIEQSPVPLPDKQRNNPFASSNNSRPTTTTTQRSRNQLQQSKFAPRHYDSDESSEL